MKILKVSRSELLRRVTAGIYNAQKDHRGWWWYDAQELEGILLENGKDDDRKRDLPSNNSEDTLSNELPAIALNGKAVAKSKTNGAVYPEIDKRERKYSGEVAKVVFEELDKGMPLDKIVTKHAVHPDVLLSIVAARARLMGGLYVSKEGRAAIEGCLLANDLDDEVKLLGEIKRKIPTRCAQCGSPARFCHPCSQRISVESAFMGGNQQHQAAAPPPTRQAPPPPPKEEQQPTNTLASDVRG